MAEEAVKEEAKARLPDNPERETSLDERLRKDKAKADAIRERQIRLGHISAEPTAEPTVEETVVETKEEKPKAVANKKT